MSIRKLPAINALQRPTAAVDFDPPSRAFEMWAERPLAASDAPATISVFSVIGDDPWGDGFSAKRMAGALRAIGDRDVTVQINSPGGDVFEGVAIYNMLAAHPAKVRIEVLGLAASIASVIAMAGDEIAMGRGAMMMVHNSWGVVVGNANDFMAAAEVFSKVDESMQSIYMARTGMAEKELVKIMDAETFMTAEDAVAKGFADALMDDADASTANAQLPRHIAAKRRIESALSHQGMSRSERRALLKEVSAGMHDAADPSGFDADAIAGLSGLLATLKN